MVYNVNEKKDPVNGIIEMMVKVNISQLVWMINKG